MLHQFLIFLLIAVWYLILQQIRLENPPPPPATPQFIWWLLLVVDLLVLAWVWTGMAPVVIKG